MSRTANNKRSMIFAKQCATCAFSLTNCGGTCIRATIHGDKVFDTLHETFKYASDCDHVNSRGVCLCDCRSTKTEIENGRCKHYKEAE